MIQDFINKQFFSLFVFYTHIRFIFYMELIGFDFYRWNMRNFIIYIIRIFTFQITGVVNK